MYNQVWMEVSYRPMAEGIRDRLLLEDGRPAIVVATEYGTFRVLVRSIDSLTINREALIE